MKKHFKLTALVLCFMLGSFANAELQRVPGTNTYYEKDLDAMTDANTSMVVVAEINDTQGETAMAFICRDGKASAFLNTKNNLMSSGEYDLERSPNLMYRVDSQQAKTIPSQTGLTSGEPDLTLLAFDDARDAILTAAFTNTTSKIVMRVLRNNGSALDYTFSTGGFKEAMRAVNSCK
ncbi:hypothetical protein [Deinococcus marmoris]|uniref:hypothetical protein n=1 Tax=Deinococcus marmoris TaxID=249408 RepID=UPI00096ABA43|nr:hypothetical protein [Deinococcus marmoris]